MTHQDVDVPDEANNAYQSFLHWLQYVSYVITFIRQLTSRFRPNIPLSATSPSLISNINSHTQYIPPHPQKGTPYHRYTVLLLPQKSHIEVPVVEMHQRLGFSVREFMAKYTLDGSTGGGVHMWRGEWNPAVSRIHRDLLSESQLTLKIRIINTILVQTQGSLSMASHRSQTGMRMSGARTGISRSRMGVFAYFGSGIRHHGNLHQLICQSLASLNIWIGRGLRANKQHKDISNGSLQKSTVNNT